MSSDIFFRGTLRKIASLRRSGAAASRYLLIAAPFIVVSLVAAGTVLPGAHVLATEIDDFEHVWVPGDHDSPWHPGTELIVGVEGFGWLTINSGGEVSNTTGRIGREAGSNGTVTVTGVGSTWTNFGSLYVGDEGSGTLLIENAGKVNGGDTRIGWEPNSRGIVTVTGAESLLEGSFLGVGHGGSGELTVEDGGTVTSDRSVIASSSTLLGTAIVRGIGSTWHSNESGTDNFLIGANGEGRLTVADGGKVVSRGAVIGSTTDGDGTVTVTGSGSTWESGSRLVVGQMGDGTLIIENGGSVSSGDGLVSSSYGSGTVNVVGGASVWEISDTLTVGDQQGTADVTVADGGDVYAPTIDLALNGGTGTLNIGASDEEDAARAGSLNTDTITFGTGDGRLVFNHTDSSYNFTPDLVGHGTIRSISGTTTLAGDGSGFTGTTRISGGELQVTGELGGSVIVEGGGTLIGAATVGSTTVADGGIIAPGSSVGTLTVDGDLALSSGSQLLYELGSPGTAVDRASGVSDRIEVVGDLTLDGTIDFSQSGDPGDGPIELGYYRLITYDGDLTDNGLEVGWGPALSDPARYVIQADGGNVDLFIAALGDDTLQHWQGGDGTWDAHTPIWQNPGGEVLDFWAGNIAIFKDTGGHTGGTITVVGDQSFKGLQFVDEHYAIQGAGRLAIDGSEGGSESADGNAEIRVLAKSAEIAAEITGSGGITKTEAGTLVLSGDNSYTGGTRLLNGGLRLEHDEALGSGALTIAGGGSVEVEYGDGVTIGNETVLRSDVTLNVAGGEARHEGDITETGGAFGIEKTGDGTLELSGSNTFSGQTEISAGTLVAAGGNAIGDHSALKVASDGAFTLKADETIGSLAGAGVVDVGSFTLTNGGTGLSTELSGKLAGDGGLVKAGEGTLLLSGDGSGFSGLTTVSGGTVRVEGELGGSIVVGSGGTLGGSGTVGTTVLAGGGALAPGSSTGTLTVNGDVTFHTGSVFNVEVDDAGNSDRLHATGKAVVEGGTTLFLESGSKWDRGSTTTLYELMAVWTVNLMMSKQISRL